MGSTASPTTSPITSRATRIRIRLDLEVSAVRNWQEGKSPDQISRRDFAIHVVIEHGWNVEHSSFRGESNGPL